ncbi:hypothetical protein HHK36_030014 [Tetracentron sinense]|uniref:RING-type E3 ubiquitin transferase n=1 Tax=Tetracentron sinense TaxID=13715 RepID=A0A834YEH4_TETSI|nr:hypothetical protein HHK36_030014 [Tetracentron sinense]
MEGGDLHLAAGVVTCEDGVKGGIVSATLLNGIDGSWRLVLECLAELDEKRCCCFGHGWVLIWGVRLLFVLLEVEAADFAAMRDEKLLLSAGGLVDFFYNGFLLDMILKYQIIMFQSSPLPGRRLDKYDQYKDWRLDVDKMSYEELLELGDRIGYVSTGLREDEILHCLRKTRHSIVDALPSHFPTEIEWKCSICQEEYKADDEVGKLDCGHSYHICCIKQWLLKKNACPVCKAAAASAEY